VILVARRRLATAPAVASDGTWYASCIRLHEAAAGPDTRMASAARMLLGARGRPEKVDGTQLMP
jgi:hypothetical protein